MYKLKIYNYDNRFKLNILKINSSLIIIYNMWLL